MADWTRAGVMQRAGALSRKTELRRGAATLRRTEFRRAPKPDATTSSAPARKRPRDTGPGREARALVWMRDAGTCVACGLVIYDGMWWSLQHRLARGQGGTNDLSNLILLCGSATSKGCHRTAEDRDEDSRLRGYWIRSGRDVDPATTPILLVRERGARSRWVLATDDGDYIDTDPPEEWAA